MPECRNNHNALWYLPAPQTCIEHGETKRCWYTYTPKSARRKKNESVPLVVDLHGYKGCASWNNVYTGWKDLSEEHGFLTVWPQGTVESGALFSHTCWDAGEGCCCHRFRHNEVDDVGFLTKMITDVIASSTVEIDRSRIYLAGHSNGCMMAQRMAAETKGLIAAVACHAGVVVMDDTLVNNSSSLAFASPNFQPVPIMIIFGDTDDAVPYDGGGPDNFRGALDNLDLWSDANGCQVAEIEDKGLYARHMHYACTNDANVEMIQVYGVGHFPYKDAKNFFQEGTSVDTTAIAWEFVSQYTMQRDF
eukprot:CAMPEP_0178919604 /NCGR_PEP_ID=MMETSP0786-20121207/14530_1 /TAXON_ID=186022 /ORGANISM="Thalassionema frauenfeldii, Strain CCMP 1798" /LENGTH=304 /DNA_ID=CAMNT_0020593555 /DNA_START=162 /DNA_END=1076 /DNA_ORIENTATION=+